MKSNSDKLLDIYYEFPFENHPLWKNVLLGKFSKDQIYKAEIQHYLRTKNGQKIREYAMRSAEGNNDKLFKELLKTYLEECVTNDSNRSHLELVTDLLENSGKTIDQLDKESLTPGNIAALAIYKEIGALGSVFHFIGAGVVEHYYSALCPKIFKAYTEIYSFSKKEAATYFIHSEMDQEHAKRSFIFIDDAVRDYGFDKIENVVKMAFIATSLHYDGMLQAAIGNNNYWNGID
ncbi:MULTISPECIES: iron-containing redox enzyme family protein [Leptospira]|uniref:iron-containing redox enzyme family protein n=1 Tax=Leptospira TaxID=171 RepID=UPI000772E39E|nr:MULTISPECIES: iron-containing redox enzyme family protein [Leptospira]OMI18926.1 hypothetical protein BUQ74_01665 [Leptospira weilii serovar Heyan]